MKREDLEKRIEILEDNIETAITYISSTDIDLGIKGVIISILESDEWKRV